MTPITLDDCHLLKDIHKECFAQPWQDFSELLKNQSTFGWLYEKVGFILGSITGNYAEILTLAVLPTYQRRCIGYKLLSTFLQNLQDCEISLEVATNNFAAISLYKKLGFTTVGIRKGYYGNGQDLSTDAYLMIRSTSLKP